MNEWNGYGFENLPDYMGTGFSKIVINTNIALFAGSSGGADAMPLNEYFTPSVA